MKLLEAAEEFAALTRDQRVAFATDLATRDTQKFMRRRDERQLPEDPEIDISLRCGGKHAMTREDSQYVHGVEEKDQLAEGAGGYTIFSRADWRLAHEYENALIKKIDHERVQNNEPESEYEGERRIRALDHEKAEFMGVSLDLLEKLNAEPTRGNYLVIDRWEPNPKLTVEEEAMPLPQFSLRMSLKCLDEKEAQACYTVPRFLALSQGPAPAADGAEPGGSLALDQC